MCRTHYEDLLIKLLTLAGPQSFCRWEPSPSPVQPQILLHGQSFLSTVWSNEKNSNSDPTFFHIW